MSPRQVAFATASSIFIFFCASMLTAVPSSFAAVPSPPPEESEDTQAGQLQFGAQAEESAAKSALAEVQAISQGIQALKSQVVDLNKDLRLMEERLLFPSSTRYTVFVSLTSDRFFQLEGIKFKLDGELVATHVYSGKQRNALSRGGVHRLYVTNLNEGKHTATVFFTGLGSNERPYKRAVTLDFDKGPGSGYLEISVGDDATAREPVFDLRQW
jgi:hypothetical protein